MAANALKTLAAVAALAATFSGGYLARDRWRPAAPAARRILYYVDPMHPSYTSDKPGIAPDCGMPLEPVYADDVQHGGVPLETEAGPAGAIRISPDRQQLIGVKYATVEAGGASRTIRAVGKVAVDETRIGHVHTRVDGWIDQMFVDFTGDAVVKGQPMLTIYSPEMLASQEELLLAARARDVMPSLFDAARRRLQLWDLSDDAIARVLASGQPIRAVTVRAPMDGVVTDRKAFPNLRVTPDTDLYTITDLSRIWIVADVSEPDIMSIRTGGSARVVFQSPGMAPLIARVSYVQPELDPQTRTLKVRLDAANPGLRMKPEMFVNVEFAVSSAPQLSVPADAVLNTGDRRTVFVDRGEGYLEPRDVTIGDYVGDRVTITRGLAAGERVVASGTFLVDAETQLKRVTASPSHAGHGND